MNKELLQQALAEIESYWEKVDDEWGPEPGGLEGAILRGEAPVIAALRAAIAQPAQSAPKAREQDCHLCDGAGIHIEGEDYHESFCYYCHGTGIEPVQSVFDRPEDTRFTVKIRRDGVEVSRPVRAEADQIDNQTFLFSFGWQMEDSDPYPGETAWLPKDATYPIEAPTWIASGDLVEVAQPEPVQLSQARELSPQEIYDIAHRKATRYTSTAPSTGVMYGFSKMHLLDFIAAINAKEGA